MYRLEDLAHKLETISDSYPSPHYRSCLDYPSGDPAQGQGDGLGGQTEDPRGQLVAGMHVCCCQSSWGCGAYPGP